MKIQELTSDFDYEILLEWFKIFPEELNSRNTNFDFIKDGSITFKHPKWDFIQSFNKFVKKHHSIEFKDVIEYDRFVFRFIGVYNKIFRMQLAYENIKREEELEIIQEYL